LPQKTGGSNVKYTACTTEQEVRAQISSSS